jgi:selenocysteine lyase/cysteine desulfurase
MGEFEFPTMAHTWLAQERRGARIRWAKARGEVLDVEAYAALIDERTLVVPATHVCFRNGFRLDVAALARLCRERGAYLFLDDYQRTGSAPLDVRALGVDFMVTGCLKYLLGPAGVAFLYVRKELIGRLEPAVTGWFGRVNPFAYAIDRLDWSASARRFEAGTPPVPNAFAARAGIELLERYQTSAIEAHVRALSGRLVEQARAAGYVVATPAEAARRGPLVVLRSTDAPRLVERLKAHGIIGSCRGDGLRISFHGYNDASDVDAVVAALQQESALLRRVEAVRA